jgi:hypothetical protein
MMGIPLRAVIAGLTLGGFAIILNMLALVMIGRINEKLEPDKRINYFHWGSGIKKQFRQLFTDSKLLVCGARVRAGSCLELCSYPLGARYPLSSGASVALANHDAGVVHRHPPLRTVAAAQRRCSVILYQLEAERGEVIRQLLRRQAE